MLTGQSVVPPIQLLADIEPGLVSPLNSRFLLQYRSIEQADQTETDGQEDFVEIDVNCQEFWIQIEEQRQDPGWDSHASGQAEAVEFAECIIVAHENWKSSNALALVI